MQKLLWPKGLVTLNILSIQTLLLEQDRGYRNRTNAILVLFSPTLMTDLQQNVHILSGQAYCVFPNVSHVFGMVFR